MPNILLTIIGYCIWLPWLAAIFRTPFSRETWHKQVLTLSWGAFLSAFCFEPVTIYFGFGLVCIAFILYCIRERPTFRLTPLAVVALAYWAWYVLSLTWSKAPIRGIQFLVDTLPLIILCWFPCWIRPDKESQTRILRIFISSATIWAGICVIGVFSTCAELHMSILDWPILQKMNIGGNLVYDYLFRSFVYHHPSYNCLVLCTAVGFATYLGKDKGWLQRGSVVLLAIVVTLITLWTQSRMGLIFLCIMWTYMLIQWLPTLHMRQIAIGVCAILCTIGVWVKQEAFQKMRQDPIRYCLTSTTWDYIYHKTWTGAGAGAINPVEIAHTLGMTWWPRVGTIQPEWTVSNWKRKTSMLPHNQFLTDWAHGGVVAFLLCIGLYVSLVYESIKEKNMTVGMFLLIFLIMSMLEPPLFITKGMYLFGAMGTLVHRT